jgi:RNA polymerase sigma-70 factor (ECF subfamily)
MESRAAQREDFEALLAPLWQRAQQGDEAAYREALGRMAERLRAYLRRRLTDRPEDVEDLLQETLLALHLQRGTHEPGRPVSHWMHAIARYKLIDHWRRQGRHGARLEAVEDFEDWPAEDAPHEAAWARRDVWQLLQRLPAAQRRAIELTKLDGLSVAQAAHETGASESAIKVQVHRGLRRLAEWVRRTPTREEDDAHR